MITKTETAFLAVGFFIIVLAMASFSIDTDQPGFNVPEAIDASMSGPTSTYEYIHKTVPITITNNAPDIDPEQELEYLYVKVQSIHADITQIEQSQQAGEPVPGNLNSITADINDVREHLLDIIGLVDDVELEQLSEELNNAKSRLEAL